MRGHSTIPPFHSTVPFHRIKTPLERELLQANQPCTRKPRTRVSETTMFGCMYFIFVQCMPKPPYLNCFPSNSRYTRMLIDPRLPRGPRFVYQALPPQRWCRRPRIIMVYHSIKYRTLFVIFYALALVAFS